MQKDTTPSVAAEAGRVSVDGELRDYATLSPQAVLALSPDQKKEWRKADEVLNDDFGFMMTFVDTLYPDCRKYYKQMKLAEMDGRPDTPLNRVFDKLLELVDEFKSDPAFEARWRKRLPELHESERRLTVRRKAEKKSERAAKKAEELAKAATLVKAQGRELFDVE